MSNDERQRWIVEMSANSVDKPKEIHFIIGAPAIAQRLIDTLGHEHSVGSKFSIFESTHGIEK
jgi:hypothetical protein